MKIDEGYLIYLLCKSFLLIAEKQLLNGKIDMDTYIKLTSMKHSFIIEYELINKIA